MLGEAVVVDVEGGDGWVEGDEGLRDGFCGVEGLS